MSLSPRKKCARRCPGGRSEILDLHGGRLIDDCIDTAAGLRSRQPKTCRLFKFRLNLSAVFRSKQKTASEPLRTDVDGRFVPVSEPVLWRGVLGARYDGLNEAFDRQQGRARRLLRERGQREGGREVEQTVKSRQSFEHRNLMETRAERAAIVLSFQLS